MKVQFSSEFKRPNTTPILKDRDVNRQQPTKFTKYNQFHKGCPIPRGETPYCIAKRAEYQENNPKKALHYYQLAIQQNDRKCSAIKDMAGLLHSMSKTQIAIQLLETYKSDFIEEKEKFFNLLENLKKQQNPKGSAANKWIKISNIPQRQNSNDFIKNLFRDSQKRIQSVETFIDRNYSIIKFNSHSGAKKSLEAFQQTGCQYPFQLEWMSLDGKVQDPIILTQKNQDAQYQQQPKYQPSKTLKSREIRKYDNPQYLHYKNEQSAEIEKLLKNDNQKPSANINQKANNQTNNNETIIRRTNYDTEYNKLWHYSFLFAFQPNRAKYFLAVDEQWVGQKPDDWFQKNLNLHEDQEDSFEIEMIQQFSQMWKLIENESEKQAKGNNQEVYASYTYF